MGIDPGFGSSSFGIVIVQSVDGVLQVLHADEFKRPRYEDMINKIADLYNMFTNIKNIFVDASNPELISSLKRKSVMNVIIGPMFKRRWHIARSIMWTLIDT